MTHPNARPAPLARAELIGRGGAWLVPGRDGSPVPPHVCPQDPTRIRDSLVRDRASHATRVGSAGG